MIPKLINREIDKFIKSINRNSPLKNASADLKDYRYPYKPALIIAIFACIPDPHKLFNKEISLMDLESPILKVYYDLITNSAVFFDYLCNQNSKDEWRYGFKNENLKKLVRKNIFENPASKLVGEDSDFWSVDTGKFSIRMQLDMKTLKQSEIDEIISKILGAAHKRITECIPDYKGYSLDELLAYYDTFKFHLPELLSTTIAKTVTHQRIQQQRNYIYSKLVKERDNKCVICCSENPSIIQACHIKPFVCCENFTEQIDIDNGVTLCANHHLLFDRGYFSFDEQWKVVISPHWSGRDFDLLIKTFEPCYQFSCQNRAIPNVYLDYHRKKIFLR